MASQMTFEVDEKLKKRVKAKAKSEGVSLKTVYNSLTEARLDGYMQLSVKMVYRDDIYTAQDHEAYLQGQEDLKNGDTMTLEQLKELYA